MQNFSFCGDGCSFWYLFLNEPILPGGERAKRASPNPRREQPVHLTFWLFRLLNFHPAQDRSYYYSIGPSSDFDSHEQSNHICHCRGGWFDLLGELFLRSPDLSLEGSLGLGTPCLALQSFFPNNFLTSFSKLCSLILWWQQNQWKKKGSRRDGVTAGGGSKINGRKKDREEMEWQPVRSRRWLYSGNCGSRVHSSLIGERASPNPRCEAGCSHWSARQHQSP